MPAQKAGSPAESPTAGQGGAGADWQNQINNIRGDCNKTGESNLNGEIGKLLNSVGDVFKSLGSLIGQLGGKSPKNCHCGCVQKPDSQNGSPSGGLKTDGKCVTTPGGYKITPTGPTSWKVE